MSAPVPKPKDPQVDRHEPKPRDSAAGAAWRQRMATDQAKTLSKERAATAECVNALARGRGLVQLTVRGRLKALAVALWPTWPVVTGLHVCECPADLRCLGPCKDLRSMLGCEPVAGVATVPSLVTPASTWGSHPYLCPSFSQCAKLRMEWT